MLNKDSNYINRDYKKFTKQNFKLTFSFKSSKLYKFKDINYLKSVFLQITIVLKSFIIYFINNFYCVNLAYIYGL